MQNESNGQPHNVLGVVGWSGSGKTTLLEYLVAQLAARGLRVTQPALRFQLEQMKPMLLTRIRQQLGEGRVKTIKFQLG